MKKLLFIFVCFALTLQLAAQQGVTKHGQNTAGPSNDFVDKNGKTGSSPALTVNGAALAASVTTATPVPYSPPPSKVVAYNVTAGGTVVSKGGSDVTVRGVCWSTTPNPVVAPGLSTPDGAIAGDGTGVYSVNISLPPGTPYYVRAYATNSTGTYYGNELTYTVPAPGKQVH